MGEEVNLPEKRKVSRWFVNGKGYATERQANIAYAKGIIRQEALKLQKQSPFEMWSKEAIYWAYEQMFPHDDDHKCSKWIRLSVRGKCSYNTDLKTFAYSWCKTRYWERIESIIKEVKK